MNETMLKIDNKMMQQPIIVTSEATTSLAQLCRDYLCVYFYPRANTPGCAQESKDFSTFYKKFKAAGCELVGISADSLKKQQNFKNKYEMPFQLVADTEEILCRAFAVIKEKNMYGKKFMGIERSTFILSPTGDVVLSWRKVKVKGHAEEVWVQLRQLVEDS